MTRCPNCRLARPRSIKVCPRCLDGPWRITIERAGRPRTRRPVNSETYLTPEEAQLGVIALRPIPALCILRIERAWMI